MSICHHAYLTVTVQVSDLPESASIAVIVALPVLSAVMLPLASTETMSGFDEV